MIGQYAHGNEPSHHVIYLYEKILDDCFSLAGNYEKKLSNTITDSEVSKINEANSQFVTVSSDTLSLIKDGIRYGKISDGTFDITIGTLSDLWKFFRDCRNRKIR